MDNSTIINAFLPFATELNSHSIRWAIGGSLLLALERYPVEANDVDIHVLIDDHNLLLELLKNYPYQRKYPNEQYKTTFFYTLHYNDIDIDILLDFKVVFNNQLYVFPFTKETPLKQIQINQTTLYLAPVSDWKNAYFAMGRTDKLALIEKGVRDD